MKVDIGSPIPAGSTQSDYLVSGAGANVWGNYDECTFEFQKIAGDFKATVRVESVNQPSGVICLFGIMARASLDPNAINCYARGYGNPGDGFKLGIRSSTGGATTSGGAVGSNPFPNVWLSLERSGIIFTAKYSLNGSSWNLIAGASLAMSDCYLGLAVCSRSPGKVASVQFRDFAYTQGAVPAPTPSWPANVTQPPTIAPAKPISAQAVADNINLVSVNWSQDRKRFDLAAAAYAVSTPGMTIDGTDILIAGAAVVAGTKPKTAIYNTIPAGAEKYAKIFNCANNALRITFRDILFRTNGGVTTNPDGTIKSLLSGYGVGAAGRDIRLENCWCENCGLAFCRGISGLEMTAPHVPVVPEYGFFAANDGGAVNENIVIRDPDFAGSITAHCLRTYGVDGMWVIGGSIRNPTNIQRPTNVVHGHPINFVDGSGYYVVNSSIEGASRLGPLANIVNSDSVNHVVVANCQHKDVMWYLESGLADCQIQDCSGSMRLSLGRTVQGRPVATGKLSRIRATGPGQFASVEAPYPLSHFFTLTDVKYNGQVVT